MKKLLKGIDGAIGGTPLVELHRLAAEVKFKGRILAKLEYLNPGYSKKDRIALFIIEEAEKNGRLVKGQPVVEATSGNTGIGLAIVCLLKGHPFAAVMSKGNSSERVKILKALGAEVVLIDQADGGKPGQVSGDDLARVDEAGRKLARERGAFFADQFHNAANTRAQEETAREIWEQCGGELDAFLDFAGTGGTFAGCAKVFKEKNAGIRCYVVEPSAAAHLSEGAAGGRHKIQGGGYCMDLPLINCGIDGFVKVTDEEAKAAARILARTEGILAGFSSGANLAAAIKLLNGAEKGNTVAFTVNDTALKYFSTDLFEG